MICVLTCSKTTTYNFANRPDFLLRIKEQNKDLFNKHTGAGSPNYFYYILFIYKLRYLNSEIE